MFGSVLMDRARVAAGADLQRSVLGAGAQVGAGVVLPDGGVRFSADV